MDEEAKIETDHISSRNEEHSTPSEPSENRVVEIDAGVYFEVKKSEMIEQKEKLEEELIRSGKKPYFASKFFKEPKIFIWILAMLSSVGGFLFGCDQSLISGASLYIPGDLNLDNSQMSMIVGFTPLGAIFGALLIIPSNEIFGRKWAIRISHLALSGIANISKNKIVENNTELPSIYRQFPATLLKIAAMI